MPDEARLAEIVRPINEKAGSEKDTNLSYVGLEHLPSRGSSLKGAISAAASISTNSVFRAGDILFGKLRPNLRKVVSAPFCGYCSTDILVLRAQEGVSPKFAGWVLRTEAIGAAAERTAIGTKMPRTSWSLLKDEKVFAPPYSEQDLIAHILDTLDTQIRRTEEVTAKLEQVKQGLITDLLTRGIDENGELRPSPEEVPELYKDSPLGPIPREWKCGSFRDFLEHVIDHRGRTPKKIGMKWGGGDILALSANNVKMGGINPSLEAYYGSEKLYRRWMTQGDPKKGDILFTMEAPLGNVAQIPDNRRYILSQRVVLLRFDRETIINNFAYWQMRGSIFRKALIQRSSGTTATGIQRAQLFRIPFLAPRLEEQASIDSNLRALDEQLANEQRQLEKMKAQKNGLMDDLLTGRVRVTPLLEQAEQATA